MLSVVALALTAAVLGGLPGQAAAVGVEVDGRRAIGRTNHDLLGFGIHRTAGLDRLRALRPATVRVDASLEHLVGCPDGAIQDEKLRELQDRLDAIEATGAETILILSYMPSCLAATGPGDPRSPSTLPPRDPGRWQQLITELVTATGPGRAASGRRPVRYYEVWNEPDFPGFWQATIAEFVTGVLLPSGRAVAAVQRSSGLDLRFGVCACIVDDPVWLGGLMQASRTAGIPVDFVSWHYYGSYPFIGPDGAEFTAPPGVAQLLQALRRRNPVLTPEVYAGQVARVRALAQAVLGRVPELMIDEWNLSAAGFDRRHDTNEGAAFQAAALAVFARAGLDRAVVFKSVDDDLHHDAEGRPLGYHYGGWGLLDRGLDRKPAWYAHWLWRRLGPLRLAATEDPGQGVWTAAARTRRRIQVLVASFQAEGSRDRHLSLRIAGVARGPYRLALHRIDARHPGSTRPTTVRPLAVGADGTARVETALPAQSVVFAQLRPQASSRAG